MSNIFFLETQEGICLEWKTFSHGKIFFCTGERNFPPTPPNSAIPIFWWLKRGSWCGNIFVSISWWTAIVTGNLRLLLRSQKEMKCIKRHNILWIMYILFKEREVVSSFIYSHVCENVDGSKILKMKVVMNEEKEPLPKIISIFWWKREQGLKCRPGHFGKRGEGKEI